MEGCVDGVYQVRLTSPPVEGAANSALVKLLAKELGVARGKVKVVAGERSRQKVVEVSGLSLNQVRELLA
jgi:uncharacterized protein (TIGR00251 family)